MTVSLASEPAPGRPVNEDAAFTERDLVGVLDGVSAPDGVDTGCRHGPAWYVARLTAHLKARHANDPALPLTALLADAIRAVAREHAGQCDLAHPNTPASTVCLLKDRGDHIEYLVLCDSPLVLDRGEVRVVSDDRFDRAIAPLRTGGGVDGSAVDGAAVGRSGVDGAEHSAALRRLISQRQQLTNQPHGYWVAAADPAAAYEAVTGTAPLHGPDRVRRAALLTDGASAAVDHFGLLDWAGLLDVLTDRGPHELIRRVRAAEDAGRDGSAPVRYKRHDDASAALCLFPADHPGDAPQ